MLIDVAYVLTGIIGAFGVFLGLNAFRTPRAAAGFGIPDTPTGDPTFRAWLSVKAVRDIAAGVFTFVVLAGGTPHLIGWFVVAAAGIPVGDALVVWRSNGPKRAVFGIHGATAAAMLAVAVLLFVG
ncbi:membrane protein [Virgisporangium aliadipatigenens]|uniref:Membrane protein n=1 Tax=Virgisporangium aliadipatigenens TaxID=741659 RepID=A0A8J4DRD6_9ACTN|nr:DUF4267 domain-containing protein [Virgisporangium aliadipatigenens]GIJ46212.1 membrane protein [Virgisporangium aliadipatigenens]